MDLSGPAKLSSTSGQVLQLHIWFLNILHHLTQENIQTTKSGY